MNRLTLWRSAAFLVGSAAVLVGHDANAADSAIAVGEVTPPPPSSGIDAEAMRDVAEGAIRELDLLPNHRHVVVSLALTRADTDPVACTINATVRDARTGVMILIIEAGARAPGRVSPELQREVAHAAVRSAINRVTPALLAK
jgi:hypothetical protein